MDKSFTTPPLFQLTTPPPPTQAAAPPPAYSLAAIHTVRKPPSKPWRRPEPAPARVYRVEPRGFRQLVQRLTGATSSAPQAPARPLKETAAPPPALPLVPRSLTPEFNDVGCFQELKTSAVNGGGGPVGFLSPTFYSGWCLSPLFSPGTVAALDHSSTSSSTHVL
ncbi:proline-rich receptor-like protein kinase PERK8 [Dioscorea cayenensis subsp. rotundata]|uniref:Proline-rich receptor-like protein kinase PERK8 n=1 Tax=Dioscorea cayennensis subsp. rotundata TaxID=55577 RepID=A0AB40CSZ1_DIOCR|nr:proline-rich receptor-like protein kinase PERK8 [Dioscorea cayenensis subsp. rotundata]